MSKAIFVYERDNKDVRSIQDMKGLCNLLDPTNGLLRDPKISLSDNIALAILNPSPDIILKNNSFYLGNILSASDTWHLPGSKIPDGSFALFRISDRIIEVITDITSSRTIYYYFDNHRFIASSSQRAIIMYLGDFHFNEQVISWMLSAGHIGPFFSWDSRIKQLRPNSKLTLEPGIWRVNIKTRAFDISPIPRKDKDHQKQLAESLKQSIEPLQIDLKKWAFLNTGNIKSKASLFFLRSFHKAFESLQCFNLEKVKSKSIELKKHAVIDNFRKNIDLNSGLIPTNDAQINENTLENFILLNEGRTDDLKNYLENNHLWERLYQEEYTGILLENDFFLHPPVTSQKEVRWLTGLKFYNDFNNLKTYRISDLPKQEIPNEIRKKKNESLEQWRDRLYYSIYLPLISAASTELKASYLETIHLLNTKETVFTFGQLPDHLRTNNTALTSVFNSLTSNILYPQDSSIELENDFLFKKDFIQLLKQNLTSNTSRKLFPEAFLLSVLKEMDLNYFTLSSGKKDNKVSLKKLVLNKIEKINPKKRNRPLLPKNNISLRIDSNVLAFRIYIICFSYKMMIKDSKSQSVVNSKNES